MFCLFPTSLPQSITEEQKGLSEELEQLKAEAAAQLTEVKSKSSAALLQALHGAPPQTVASLVEETQQLALQLQQAEEKIKVCRPHFV